MLPTSLSKALRVTIIAATLVGFSASVSVAQTGTGSSGVRGTATVQLSSGATFNWFAKKTSKHGKVSNAVLVSSENAPLVKTSRYFGKGSYICSPAGFGKKSRCFAR